MKRAVLPLILALALGSALALPSGAAGQTCATSGPGSYTVTVCVGLVENSVLSGRVTIPITVTATGGKVVKEVQAYLSGTYVLTDFEVPWGFDLPTRKWVDGSYRIQVEAVIKADPAWTSARTKVPVEFDNGISVPPANKRTFDPPSVPRVPGGAAITVAAVGDGVSGETVPDRVANLVASWNPSLFLYLGDVYQYGTPTEFANWYDDRGNRWAQMRDVTAPTPGNHEYVTPGAFGYFNFWDNIPPYYSFDANGWHVISIDANSQVGLGVGSAQYEWLVDDLQASKAPCTAVISHQPRFSVGSYEGSTLLQPAWALLANEGVDVWLASHDHNYQRWKPLDATGQVDSQGLRQFIVGTGGRSSYAIERSDPRVDRAIRLAGGALRMSFWPKRASYQFVGAGGGTLDSGSFTCSTKDVSAPTSPTLSGSALSYDRVRLRWTESTDDVGVTKYRIFRDGVLVKTVKASKLSWTDTSVQERTMYAYEVEARDASGKTSPRSNTVTVTTPKAPDTTPPSEPGNVVATVTDRFNVNVDWTASTDDEGVAGYDIYRDGQLLRADVAATEINDGFVEPGDSFSYTVVAKDAAGNESTPGGPATANVPGYLFWEGFESGTMSGWTYSRGISIVSGSPPAQHGNRSARMISNGTATFATEQLASTRTALFMRTAFRIESQGDNGVDLVRFRTSTGTGIATVVVDNQDRVALFDERNGTTIASSQVVGQGWHDIQLKVTIAGSSSRTAVWLDGEKINSLTLKRNLGTSPIGRAQIGDARGDRTYDVRFDDVAVNPTFIAL